MPPETTFTTNPLNNQTNSAKLNSAKLNSSTQQATPAGADVHNGARSQLVQQLQTNIRHLETIHRIDDGSIVSGGCPAIDDLLPEGGYRRGTLVEWITLPQRRITHRQNMTSGGCGADFLSLATAQLACADGGALVIVDPHSQFYPPAAVAMGVSFANTILIRPGSADPNELYWAVDQALRCEAVGAVWGILDHLGERWFRRFQLSAESSGVMGFFVRPAVALQAPSWSETQWQVTPIQPPGNPSTKRVCELKLSRCRSGPAGERIQVEIDTVTGSVHGRRVRTNHEPMHEPTPMRVASQLAHSAAGGRKSRA